MLLLELDTDREDVVIARGQQFGDHEGPPLLILLCKDSQIRLWIRRKDSTDTDLYRCEPRTWLCGGWSPWREHRSGRDGASFNIHDVLATDWRFVS